MTRSAARTEIMAIWDKILAEKDIVPQILIGSKTDNGAVLISAKPEPTSEEIEAFLARLLVLIRQGRMRMVDVPERNGGG